MERLIVDLVEYFIDSKLLENTGMLLNSELESYPKKEKIKIIETARRYAIEEYKNRFNSNYNDMEN